VSLVSCQLLADKKITICPHPPHSPNLALSDFWLLPEIKLTTKENRFDTMSEIETGNKNALKKDDVQISFRSWQDRWNKCIDSKGDYLNVTNCTLKLM
jgi:hypothetical protein